MQNKLKPKTNIINGEINNDTRRVESCKLPETNILNGQNYNPDVLSCIANLSSDEVFTPPDVVKEMLDLLPQKLFESSKTRFLDPACKSGVFLREIAKRLIKGLEKEIPDLQKRLNHIYTKQLFGIAITELTALLSRRTLYCSKSANGKYSVCDAFSKDEGNVIYPNTEHTWQNGNCIFCGANQAAYDRGEELESHAYTFIHTENPEELFKMKFDVIIGNPPYQLSDGGGTGKSAKPIYQHFVTQAKKLSPRYLTMIIPSRWFSGGKGLDSFRSEMLNDDRIRQLVDYTDSTDVFSGVDIAGGICFFLWDRDNRGKCKITNIQKGEKDISERSLNEFETFVRNRISVNIINKVKLLETKFMDEMVSSRRPFGIDSKDRGTKEGDLKLIWSGGEGHYKSEKVIEGKELMHEWKVLLSKTSHDHGGQPDKDGKRRILSRIEVLPPGYICTESYLIIGPFDDVTMTNNMISYLRTKFCRFLVSTILFTQNITKDRFRFVPIPSVSESWTDEKLYQKYNLNLEEINFIESMIRPMELDNG